MSERPRVEAVCSCGYRIACSEGSIGPHMRDHGDDNEWGEEWHIEVDGEDLDALSGAERRRRTNKERA